MRDSVDRQLEATRDALLRQIPVPELSLVRARAAQLRRRRTALTAGASALALVLVIGLGVVIAGGSGLDRQPQPAATNTLSGPRWDGPGLTLYGLTGDVLELPGGIVDVEFADPDHGYAITAECVGDEPCDVRLAATADGGYTWTASRVPQAKLGPNHLPRMIAVSGGLYLVNNLETWFRPTAGAGDQALWQLAFDPSDVGFVPTGGRLALTSDTCGSELRVWPPDGRVGRLATPPDLTVCSVAAEPTGGGAWWVGGQLPGTGEPAVAVSRDQGRTWTVTRLADGPGRAMVSPLGNRVFATVVTDRGGDPYPETLAAQAVYRSVDNGPFMPYVTTTSALLGEVIPLLDGRLVSAGPDWQVSDGGAFDRTTGSLPWVRRFARTPGAWVAYDLFRGGWAAVSVDGQTWHKINVH